MRLTLLNKTASMLLTCLLGIAATAPQAEAAPKTPRVTSVELDTDAGTMVVTGRDFGGKKFRGNVRLHLAETGPITLKKDEYKKLQPSDEVPILLQQLKLSGIPQNIDDFAGVHLLEVRRKYKEKVDGASVVKYQIGTSLVTIGAQGPAGTDGVDGEQGPKGDKGDQGVAGPAGRDGIDGADGEQGPKGDQGDRGPQGSAGTDGVGVSQTTIDSDGNFIVTLTNGTEINAGQVGNSNGTLKLSKNSAVFDYTGGTGSVDIQSNTDWTWQIEADGWITSSIDSYSQNGNQTFTYEVSELYRNTSREASILFQSTNGPKYEWYFTVRQEPARWQQLGADIDGEDADDVSGSSVSLSADGSTVAIGAPFNDGNGDYSGHVRIYQYINSSWQQLGADIDGEDADDVSGWSVSLSADGSTVAIGAPVNEGNDGNGFDSGHVRVFRYDGTSWEQLGNDINGEAESDWFGSSVSLSADGSTVAIEDLNRFGSNVRIYQYINSSWQQLGVGIDVRNGEQYKQSVSLSADGITVAIVTKENDGIDAGRVRVYQYIDLSWQQLGADIEGEAAGEFNGSVSLSADGSTVAIGMPFDGNGYESGHVRIYRFNGASWWQLGPNIDGEAEGDEFGNSVSLSADGSTVAIGAHLNNSNGSDSGHVRVYQYIDLSWVQLGANIDGEAASDFSGKSVSLSADGSILAIGATGNDGNGSSSGHVRVYELTQEP